METVPRHQCIIYDGSPSRLLPELAAVTRAKLQQNYRCLYLNSEPMVAGMRSYLAAAGVDVAQETAKTSLVLTSARQHLCDGHFDIDRMMQTLGDTLEQALGDGYAGLWATGDMTWEMGPELNYSKLLEYERRLETFFGEHSEISGICQYHTGTLPREAVKKSLLVHPSIFVNQTLSMMNPHYMHGQSSTGRGIQNPQLDAVIDRVCALGTAS